MHLKRDIAGLLTGTLIVVHGLPVERDKNSSSNFLDQKVVPLADPDLRRQRRRLQAIDGTGEFTRMTFGLRHRIVAPLVDLDLVSFRVRLLKRIGHIWELGYGCKCPNFLRAG
jgi:hypothetical protein